MKNEVAFKEQQQRDLQTNYPGKISEALTGEKDYVIIVATKEDLGGFKYTMSINGPSPADVANMFDALFATLKYNEVLKNQN